MTDRVNSASQNMTSRDGRQRETRYCGGLECGIKESQLMLRQRTGTTTTMHVVGEFPMLFGGDATHSAKRTDCRGDDVQEDSDQYSAETCE